MKTAVKTVKDKMIDEQAVRTKYFNEAQRYMANARENLKKAKKENDFYGDPKYVRTACGVAHLGVLIALDGYALLKGIEPGGRKKRKSIEFYHEFLGKQDRKLNDTLIVEYQILHLAGYYDGCQDAVVIKRGFDLANEIIDKIKPKE